ncbi:MAG TPA: DUF1569 domain-containing protein [Pyrinomonadaceae bacterium]|nr:DUF1569 domain-containing protein [Pyrinomonadaceae bacterium]
MGSILNENERTVLLGRMQSLSASSTARWGKMNVVGMLQHLQLSARMALGELPVASVNKRPFQMFPLKHLLLYVVPFPKGAPTAGELKPGEGSAFVEEHATLIELLERIGTGPKEGSGPAHPLFGPLTWREWGVVTYKHVDHHLKQFGA